MNEKEIIQRRLRNKRFRAKKKVETRLCHERFYKDNINSSAESEISEPSKPKRQALSSEIYIINFNHPKCNSNSVYCTTRPQRIVISSGKYI